MYTRQGYLYLMEKSKFNGGLLVDQPLTHSLRILSYRGIRNDLGENVLSVPEREPTVYDDRLQSGARKNSKHFNWSKMISHN